jgi:hypothetical protein
MNRLMKNLGIAENFSIKAVLAVEELMNHDMIYIYHHITNGTTVQLLKEGTNLSGEPRFAVKYGPFLLGYVTISGIMSSFYEGHHSGEAEVVGVSKDKFMPIKGLDIKVGVQAMKKVG